MLIMMTWEKEEKECESTSFTIVAISCLDMSENQSHREKYIIWQLE